MKMQKHFLRIIFVFLFLYAFSGSLHAQNPQNPPPPPLPPTPSVDQARSAPTVRPTVPLLIRLVLSEYEGERKVTSLPYTVNFTTSRPASSLRLGVRVPIVVLSGPNKDPQIQYQDVGTNIDCGAEVLPDSAFEINLTIERSTVYSVRDNKPVDWSLGDPPISSQPVFRTFRSSGRLVMREGQSMQVTWATDPVSGRVLRVEATLQSAR